MRRLRSGQRPHTGHTGCAKCAVAPWADHNVLMLGTQAARTKTAKVCCLAGPYLTDSHPYSFNQRRQTIRPDPDRCDRQIN